MNLVYSDTALKNLKKMNKQDAKRILDYMDEIAELEDPYSRGHGLLGDKKGIWRYRCESWRILCEVKNNEMHIYVLEIGHRRNVYRA